MLPDVTQKRCLFTTGDVGEVMTGSRETCGLACFICVLGFFGLSNRELAYTCVFLWYSNL